MPGEALKQPEGEQTQKESTKKYDEISDKNSKKLNDDLLQYLTYYTKGEKTETGVSNAFDKNADGMSKTDLISFAKKYNININTDKTLSSDERTKQFQTDMYTKLYSTPQGKAVLKAMWDTWGNTNEGKSKNVSTDALMKDLQTGLKAFVDGKLGARVRKIVQTEKEVTSSTPTVIEKTKEVKSASEKLAEDFKLGDGEPMFLGDKAIGTMYFTRPKGDRGYSNYQYVALDFGHMTKGGAQNMTENRYKNTTKGTGLEDAFNNVILIPAEIVNTQFNGGRTQTAEWYKALYDMANNQKLSGQWANNFNFMDQSTKSVISEKIRDARVLSNDGTIGLDVASVAVK